MLIYKERLMKKLFFVLLSCIFSTVSYGGEWSQYPSCDAQYSRDSAVCRSLLESDKVSRQKCWSSAADRLAKCNSSKGKTLNSPTLQKWKEQDMKHTEHSFIFRTLELFNEDTKHTKKVLVHFYVPTPEHDNNWACSYCICGLPDIQEKPFTVFGVDSLQAFLCAITAAEGLIQGSDAYQQGKLKWGNKNTAPFLD